MVGAASHPRSTPPKQPRGVTPESQTSRKGVKMVRNGRIQRSGPARHLPTKSSRFEKPEPTHVYRKLGLAEVYERQCKALFMRPNSELLRLLPRGPNLVDTVFELQADANYLGDKGCRAVVEVLRLGQCIQHVRLAANGLTDTALSHLVPVLRAHPSVTAVDLAGNKLTQGSVGALRALLQGNRSLTALRLEGNPNLFQAGLDELNKIVCANRALAEEQRQPTPQKNPSAKPLTEVLSQWSRSAPDAVDRREGLDEYLRGRRPPAAPHRNRDGWAIVNVFVSSTFTDFNSELHVISHKVVPELNRRLRKYKVHLLPIDLHQSRQYGCDNIENIMNVKYILGTLRRSSDVFLGLYGEMLGWVPATDEVPGSAMYDKVREYVQKEPVSINFMLFLDGWLHRRGALESPMGFFYLRHPNALIGLPDAMRPQFADSAQRRRVAAVERSKITSWVPKCLLYEGYGGHFKTVDPHGAIQMCRLRDFEETVQLDLFNAVRSMYTVGRGDEDSRINYAERQWRRLVFSEQAGFFHPAKRRVGGPYGDSMDEYFSVSERCWQGRDEELRRLREAATQKPSDPTAGPRLVLVRGARGAGLTSALGALYRELRRHHDSSVITLRHFPDLVSLVPDAWDQRCLLRHLYLQSVAPPGGGVQPSYSELEDEVLNGTEVGIVSVYFWHHISEIARETGRRVVIIADASELAAGTAAAAFSWISERARVPVAARVVIAVPSDRADLAAAARQVDPRLVEVPLDPLLIKDRRQLVPALLTRHRVTLADASVNDIVRRDDAGLPLYLMLICHSLLHRSPLQTVAQELRRLPRDLGGLIGAMLRQREAQEANAGGLLHFVRFISLLCCSRAGLTALEARQLLVAPFQVLDRRLAPERGACAEDYVAGLSGCGGGFESDSEVAHRHSQEHAATRKRLWGRWADTPRLLPGSIWSRIAFEVRPFVQRQGERGGGSPADTFVYAFTGSTVRDACSARYLSSRRRTARMHAQLGLFYRSKAHFRGGPLSMKGMREAMYHLCKAWLWETAIARCFHPVWVYYALRDGLLHELGRDLHAAEAEMDRCLAAHAAGRNTTVHAKLLAHHQCIVEYANLVSECGLMLQSAPELVFPLALNSAQGPLWRHAAEHLAFSNTMRLSGLTRPFYSAREIALPHQAQGEAASGRGATQQDPLAAVPQAAESRVTACSRWVATWALAGVPEVSGSEHLAPGALSVWKASTMELQLRLCVGDGHVTACCFAADSAQVAATSSEAGVALVWALPSGEPLARFKLPPRGAQLAVTHGCLFSPASPPLRPDSDPSLVQRPLLCWDTAGRCLLWENHADPHPTDLVPDSSAVVHAAFSPAGAKVVVACEDSTCSVHATSGGRVSGYCTLERPRFADFVRGSSQLVVTCTDRRVIVFGADDGAPRQCVDIDARVGEPLAAVAYFPQEGVLATVDPLHRLSRWQLSAETSDPISPLPGQQLSKGWSRLWGGELQRWALSPAHLLGVSEAGVAVVAAAAGGSGSAQCVHIATETPPSRRGVGGRQCPRLLPWGDVARIPAALPAADASSSGSGPPSPAAPRPPAEQPLATFVAVDATSGVPMRLAVLGANTSLPVDPHEVATVPFVQ
eukprot:TRINITY_DN55515_c0_g1_i1.p1 TRINITY_DN55515_c0_g1~~TRINITY_DN55515_c0_g1_i1.p1  ORF type:complete len:1605 (+),score=415.52 TRINITY_DN55515_c0_g1_i1:92-4906(+)